MSERDATDWAAWSREAVAAMQARNDAWPARYGLEKASYRWDLDRGEIVFTSSQSTVIAKATVVGTTSDVSGTFLWSWANPELSGAAVHRIDEVQTFGARHTLPLLAEPEWPGARAEGLEAAAIAGRILDAPGLFIDELDGGHIFFVLTAFTTSPDD